MAIVVPVDTTDGRRHLRPDVEQLPQELERLAGRPGRYGVARHRAGAVILGRVGQTLLLG